MPLIAYRCIYYSSAPKRSSTRAEPPFIQYRVAHTLLPPLNLALYCTPHVTTFSNLCVNFSEIDASRTDTNAVNVAQVEFLSFSNDSS